MIEERRKNSDNLIREMRTRSEGWSTLERLAVLDMLGTKLLREGLSIEALTQQVSNIIRKAPEFEAIDPSPNCSPGCPPVGNPVRGRVHVMECPTQRDSFTSEAGSWRGEGLMAAPPSLDELAGR